MVRLESPDGFSQSLPDEDAEAMREREFELWGRMLLLTASGWESFMIRVLEAEEVPEAVRRDAIFRTQGSWISKDPGGVPKIIAKAPAFFGSAHGGNSLLGMTIYHLAKVDPVAAAKLVQHPEEHLAEWMTDRIRMSLISGTAFKDPALALRMMDEIGIKDRRDTIFAITETTRTATQKTAVLAAMRDRLPALADDGARCETSQTVLSGLASTFAYGNFGEAKQWFESAKLSPEELAICARQLQSSVLRPETGLWIEWFGTHLSPEDSSRITSSMMRSWAENDHQAAADWLSNSKVDGAAKAHAIAGYADIVSRYEPEVAARWVLTLPDGKDRDNSLRVVRSNWPSAQSAARDAFAKEHGFTWP
jgi:hypothetical protein